MSDTTTTEEMRALDREIAELLGWAEHPDLVTDGPGGEDVPLMVSPCGDTELDIPAYSSTWEGFGLLVEECERRGWGYSLNFWAGKDGTMAREATLKFPGSPSFGLEVDGRDIRHACALAMRDALKAQKEQQP